MQVKIILVHQKSKINFHIINFSNIGEAILNLLAGITKKDKNIGLGKPQVWFEELIFYQLESQNKKSQVQQTLGLAKSQVWFEELLFYQLESQNKKRCVQKNPRFSKPLGLTKPQFSKTLDLGQLFKTLGLAKLQGQVRLFKVAKSLFQTCSKDDTGRKLPSPIISMRLRQKRSHLT